MSSLGSTTRFARPSGHATCCRPNPIGGRASVARFAARAGRVGVRAARHADVRARRGRAEARVEQRRRAQGAVRLHRQGRPRAGVARRRHRFGGAGVRAAPAGAAVEGLVRRAELPVRAAAEGAVPPALAGRRRGARRRGSGRRRRGDRARARLLPGARVVAVPADRSTRWATPTSRTRYRDVLLEYWRDHKDAAGRRDGARRGEPAAHPRLEARGLGGHARAGSADRRVPLGRVGRAVRARSRRDCRRSASTSRSRRGSCAASTTTPVRRSSSRATRSTRRRTRSAPAAGTTGWPRTWAARRPPGIGFGIGIERVLIACDGEGVFGAPAAARRRVRRRRCSAAPKRSCWSRSCGRWGCAPNAPTAAARSGSRWPPPTSPARATASSSAPRRPPPARSAIKDLESGDQLDVHRDEAAAWLRTRLDPNGRRTRHLMCTYVYAEIGASAQLMSRLGHLRPSGLDGRAELSQRFVACGHVRPSRRRLDDARSQHASSRASNSAKRRFTSASDRRLTAIGSLERVRRGVYRLRWRADAHGSRPRSAAVLAGGDECRRVAFVGRAVVGLQVQPDDSASRSRSRPRMPEVDGVACPHARRDPRVRTTRRARRVVPCTSFERTLCDMTIAASRFAARPCTRRRTAPRASRPSTSCATCVERLDSGPHRRLTSSHESARDNATLATTPAAATPSCGCSRSSQAAGLPLPVQQHRGACRRDARTSSTSRGPMCSDLHRVLRTRWHIGTPSAVAYDNERITELCRTRAGDRSIFTDESTDAEIVARSRAARHAAPVERHRHGA